MTSRTAAFFSTSSLPPSARRWPNGGAQHEDERRKARGAWRKSTAPKTAFFSNVQPTSFRTPLTLMVRTPWRTSWAERPQIPLAARAARAASRTAHRNTLRLLKLVNTLLDFFAHRSGPRSGELRGDQSCPLYHGAGQLCSALAVEKGGLTLTVDLSRRYLS